MMLHAHQIIYCVIQHYRWMAGSQSLLIMSHPFFELQSAIWESKSRPLYCGHTSCRVTRRWVLLTRNRNPLNRSALVVTILITLEPEHLSLLRRESDSEVEQLIESVRKEPDVGNRANVLELRLIHSSDGRVRHRRQRRLVDDRAPVPGLLNAHAVQPEGHLNSEVGRANRVVATVVPDAKADDRRLTSERLRRLETHVRGREAGHGEECQKCEKAIHFAVKKCFSRIKEDWWIGVVQSERSVAGYMVYE